VDNRADLETFVEDKNHLHLPRIELRYFGYPFRGLAAVPTGLSRFTARIKVDPSVVCFVLRSREIVREVNVDKTKYMVMSRDRNAGRGHSVKIDNSSIERAEEFNYLGTTLTDQNSISKKLRAD